VGERMSVDQHQQQHPLPPHADACSGSSHHACGATAPTNPTRRKLRDTTQLQPTPTAQQQQRSPPHNTPAHPAFTAKKR
jgi:hypothetical protein